MASLARRKTRSYSFVIRLLLSTLLAALIPLMITSSQQLNEQVDNFNQNIELQLQENASAIATRLDSCVKTMDSVSLRFMMDPTFSTNMLGGKVSSQLTAFKSIEDYFLLLPFVKDYGIYDSELDHGYTLTGMYTSTGIARNFFCVEEETFQEYLTLHSSAPGFIAQSGDTGEFVYISPLRLRNTNRSMRYMLFLISPNSLMEFLKSEIPDRAAISALSCEDQVLFGTFVSDTEADRQDDLLSKTAVSSNGLRVQLSTDRTIVLQNLDDITGHSISIIIINTLLCIFLIAAVVFLNYRPLAKIIKRIRSDAPRTSQTEIETLISHFTSLEQKNKTLSLELYEKRMMITDRILENLLSGKKVPATDIRTIQLKLPYYRVICVPLDRIRNVSDVITNNLENPTVYAIEMYADKLLAILCGQATNDEAALNTMLQNIRALLQDDSIPLGISAPFPSHSLSSLYVAYHQAGRALANVNGTSVCVFSTSADSVPSLLDEKLMDVGKLSRAISNGQDYMVELATQVLDELLTQPGMRANQRYVCYQLIDLYRIAFDRSGVDFDVTRLTQTLQECSIATLKERFLTMLNAVLQERKDELEKNIDQTHTKLISYINANYTDPMLSMDMVAEYMGISVFTASRVFKSLIGINFRQYLNDLRIEYARELLLTTELSVSDISQKAGFTSASYFISTFKKSEDVTPHIFRIQNGMESLD